MSKFVSIKVGTPNPVRLSYVTLSKPKSFADGGTAKYSAVLLIPKKDTKTVEAIKKAAKSCFDSNASLFKGYKFESIFKAMRDGAGAAEKGKAYPEEYADYWVMNVSNARKPKLNDADGNELLDEDELYSGCWAKVGMTMFAYNFNNVPGISVSLDLVKKHHDDERMGGGGDAREEDYFGDDDDI